MTKNLDLPVRREERFFVSPEQSLAIVHELGEVLAPLTFENGGFVQTLYFNTPDHIVSFGTSIRARRYPSQFLEGRVEANREFFLEVKRRARGGGVKEKIRKKMPLDGIVEFLEGQFSDGHVSETSLLDIPGRVRELKPYVGVEYHRHHFIPRAEQRTLRMTIDDSVTYYSCPKDLSLPRGFQMTQIGHETLQRLELKVARGMQNDPRVAEVYVRVKRLLDDFQAIHAVSKKYSAYERFHRKQTKSLVAIVNELEGFEIEAKLALDDPNLFSRLKIDAMQGHFEGFVLAPDFSDSSEVQAIHGYLVDGHGNELGKLLFSGSKFKLNEKEAGEVVDDPHNLGCILKRPEQKGKYKPFSRDRYRELVEGLPAPALVLGYLDRTKKKFYLMSEANGRKYGISVDRCVAEGNVLVQLEIEYLGTNRQPAPPSSAEPEIVRDIADITQQCLRLYPDRLQPTAETKFAWLKTIKAER